jgi:hypothetical protein
MESQYNKNTKKETRSGWLPAGGGRVAGGVIVVIVGTVLFAKQFGAYFPEWMFKWYMIPIVIGLYVGARHRFRNFGWLIPIIIGSVFLVQEVVPGVHVSQYAWPLIIIGVGLFMIFRPRGSSRRSEQWWEMKAEETDQTSEGFFESVTVFGENKKQILSKDFKGGESVCFFGGAEINLTQADINGRVSIELVQVFGGTRLIIPSNWKLETEEMVSVFGGLNDKRQFQNTPTDQSKVLVLKGTCIFGGIDIKSF